MVGLSLDSNTKEVRDLGSSLAWSVRRNFKKGPARRHQMYQTDRGVADIKIPPAFKSGAGSE